METKVCMTAQGLLWRLLIGFRWLSILAPQRGYIHPDEFFQSAEIVAGDVLDLEVYRSWEFTSSRPIRSIFFPLLSCAPAFHLLRLLTDVDLLGRASPLYPYLLLVLPRLTVGLFGAVADWLVLRLARRVKVDVDATMLLYTSSYISLVHFTRTLSNTTEAFLFVLLLFLTVMHHPSEKTSSLKRKSIHERKPTASASYAKNSFLIGVVTAIGCFNRPTFVCFATVPYTCWLLTRLPRGRWLSEVVRRLCSSCIAAVLTALLLAVCDSLYYGTLDRIDIQDVVSASEFFGKLTLTPWNFVQYNVASENLSAHGVHARYTHAAINLQTLFALLPLCAVWKARSLWHAGSAQRLLLLSCAVPVIALSLFPHQEARFLIPLLPPLALLCGERVFGAKSSRLLRLSWIAANVAGALWFGVLHQGGLGSAVANLRDHAAPDVKTHVVFFHTYMPPRFLLADSDRALTLHDLAGASLPVLNQKLKELDAASTNGSQRLLISPATIDRQLQEANMPFHFEMLRAFPLHVSGEDWPRYEEDVLCSVGETRRLSTNRFCNATFPRRLLDIFTLNLYKVMPKLL